MSLEPSHTRLRNFANMTSARRCNAATFEATVSTGSELSVVSSHVARRLGIRGRDCRVKLTLPQDGCRVHDQNVVVVGVIARQYRDDVIVGMDYLDAVRITAKTVTCYREREEKSEVTGQLRCIKAVRYDLLQHDANKIALPDCPGSVSIRVSSFYRRCFMDEVERRIFYYRVLATKGVGAKSVPVSPLPFFQNLAAIKYPDTYYKLTNGDRVMCEILNAAGPGKQVRGLIGKTRMTNISEAEYQGKRTPLPLKNDQGLNDLTHWIFFPATSVYDDIIGMEFNFYAPRISRLSDYMKDKATASDDHVSFLSILADNMFDKALGFTSLKKLELKVARNSIDLISEQVSAPLGQAIRDAAKTSGAETVDVVFSAEARKTFSPPLWWKKLVAFAKGDEGSAILVARATGSKDAEEKAEDVDLLGSRLVHADSAVRLGSTRSVQAQSMFEGIVRGHTALARIIHAMSISGRARWREELFA